VQISIHNQYGSGKIVKKVYNFKNEHIIQLDHTPWVARVKTVVRKLYTLAFYIPVEV
jgi:hypothetical protein